MKRFALLLIAALSLGACKQSPKQQDGVEVQPLATVNVCDYFSTLPSMSTDDQVKWLRSNQIQACKAKYDSCRENAHIITPTVYSDGIAEYWKADPVIYTEITLGTIKALSAQSMYVQFISFVPDSQNTIVPAAVIDFTTTPSCYSVPLFYSIGRLHSLSNSSILMFTRAIIGGNETIVFAVKGTSYNYDASSFPL